MLRKRDFARLRQHSPANWKLLIEAAVWLGLARSAVLALPFRWITRMLALTGGPDMPGVDHPAQIAGERVGWAIRAVSARTPWQSTCLVQALAGTGMLRARGIPSSLALGVAKTGGKPEAHAWLTCGPVILTGAGGRERFQVVARFTQATAHPAV